MLSPEPLKTSLFTLSGGKYTLPSVSRQDVASATTVPLTRAVACPVRGVMDLPTMLERRFLRNEIVEVLEERNCGGFFLSLFFQSYNPMQR